MNWKRFITRFKPAIWGFLFATLSPNTVLWKIASFSVLVSIYILKEYVETNKEDPHTQIGKVWRWVNEDSSKKT